MALQTLTKIRLNQFTAFTDLAISLSPGINVFIGPNATGKTHILKALYAASDITRTDVALSEKLVRVFLPHQRRLGRLVHRQRGGATAFMVVSREESSVRIRFTNQATDPSTASTRNEKQWKSSRIECAYIPVKEMLAHAPGFRSLYESREVHFEETYADIVDRAFRPFLKGPPDESRRSLLNIIEKAIQGKVITEQEVFFLKNPQGKLEFTLLAEGMRKLALLWILIQNGTLLRGSVLFWDEPETNLNPKMIRAVIEILLRLQRMGVQIFVATHSYVVLKELDLQKTPIDSVTFHALYRDERTNVVCESVENYVSITKNSIQEAYLDLYDRDVDRALKP